MTDLLSNEEVRYFAIELMTAATDRDRQTRIGASDLGNQCDRCLAGALSGAKDNSPISDKTWLGRTTGTAIHSYYEARQAELAWFAERFPDAKAEEHVFFHEFDRYGWVGGTIDILLGRHQLIDIKSSTRKKSAILQDYIALATEETARWGRKNKEVAGAGKGMMSQSEYDKEIERAAFKLQGYYGQQTLYMHGRIQHGDPCETATLLFVNRDGTGFFDVPDGSGYDDPAKVHDIWTHSFAYDADYAEYLLVRGQRIIDALHAGAALSEFDRHPLCFSCGTQIEQEKRDTDITATFGSLPAAA